MKELEDSLALGPPMIQGQYTYDMKRFGETYACGDPQAREQMKDVLITLQDAVLSNLQNVWMDDEPLDCTALQTASDDSRVNAMVCLGQLSQRISAAAAATARLPRENMLYPVKNDLMPLSPSLQYSSSRSTQSSGGSSSQPMTPEPLMDRITQMTQGQYVQKQPY